MKSILLYANDDPGLETRLEAALDLVRTFEGHLHCVHATPYQTFITGDPFGGIYASPTVVEELAQAEQEQRQRIEARLSRADISWDWVQADGPPASVLVDRSRLADLIVLSLAGERDRDQPAMSLAAEIAVHARGPVLAMPPAKSGFAACGVAAVAWNGSPEAGHSLRMALPLLQEASAIRILTVSDDEIRFPADEARQYLARHNLPSKIVELPGTANRAGAALLAAAKAIDASYIVMGAYGHTRFREAILGGVTRQMIAHSSIPLLLAH